MKFKMNMQSALILLAAIFLFSNVLSLTGDYSQTIANSMSKNVNIYDNSAPVYVGSYATAEPLGTIFTVSLYGTITDSQAPVKWTFVTDNGAVLGSVSHAVGAQNDFNVGLSTSVLQAAYVNTRLIKVYVISECLNQDYAAQCAEVPGTVEELTIAYDIYNSDTTDEITELLEGGEFVEDTPGTSVNSVMSSSVSTFTGAVNSIIQSISNFIGGIFS